MSNQQAVFELRATGRADGRAAIEACRGDQVLMRDTVELQSAEDRRRCAMVIRQAAPTLEIDAIERELLAFDPKRLPPASGSQERWREPQPIEQPQVPEFPLEVLPEPLRSFVDATAEACQVPADLPGLLTLAMCSGAVARRIEIIAGRGWIEPINLYIACLLDPANRKSSVFAAAVGPLKAIEHELVEAARPHIARLISDRRVLEKELAELEKRAAKGCGESREQAGELAAKLAMEPEPSLPKLLLDDATAEAVEAQLALQRGRLIVAGCEGGLFSVMAGRYSSGMANFDCFLKGHAGDDLRVDRVTRGSIVVDRCCLTLAYAVQPDVIRGLARQPSFRGRGLIGRFLYAVPQSLLGRRRI
ncbi:MAG: YfjI family protein, partial [Aureliella sp.]